MVRGLAFVHQAAVAVEVVAHHAKFEKGLK